jgi:hypothetical protein
MLSEVKHLKNVDLIMLMADLRPRRKNNNNKKQKKDSEPVLELGGYHR